MELLASAAGLRLSGYSLYERVGFAVSVYRRLTICL
jgi:hypothetical protein